MSNRNYTGSDITSLAAAIAHSPIVVTQIVMTAAIAERLPAGFDDRDLAILQWIAAERCRVKRSYLS